MGKSEEFGVGHPVDQNFESRCVPAEDRLAGAVEIVLACDALCAEDLENLPSITGASMKAQGMLAMGAVGYSQGDIAEAYGVSQQAVSDTVRRLDPNGMFRLSPTAKRAFVSKLAEGKALAAIGSIKLSEMKESTPVERARIAKTLTDISQTLNQTKHKEIGGSKLDVLLDSIEKERLSKMPEAEIIEERKA